MNEGAQANLDAHFQRLERKVRRLEVGLSVLVGVVAVLAGALVLQRMRIPTNISARGFSVVDESGNVVAGLGRSANGGVLVLESRRAGEKILLGMLDNSAGLALVARDLVRASLTVGQDGSSPALTILDQEGRTRIMSGLDAADLPTMSIWNRDARLDFLVRPGYSPILQVFDDDGSALLSVRSKKDRHREGDSKSREPRPRVIRGAR